MRLPWCCGSDSAVIENRAFSTVPYQTAGGEVLAFCPSARFSISTFPSSQEKKKGYPNLGQIVIRLLLLICPMFASAMLVDLMQRIRCVSQRVKIHTLRNWLYLEAFNL